MYIPKHFEEPRIELMQALLRKHPLGVLVTLSADGINANHIPFHLKEDGSPYGVLQAHIARANPLWTNCNKGVEVLAIFQTENTYISPSWYASKQETGKVVPTWNYAAVHVYGTLQFYEDTVWIRQQLETLTAENEAQFPIPWTLADAPLDFTEKLLQQIVGIEIKISKMLGKWKVSQNQPAKNQAGVIQGLLETGKPQAAELIMDAIKLSQNR